MSVVVLVVREHRLAQLSSFIHILCTGNCVSFCVGVLSERNVRLCAVCTVRCVVLCHEGVLHNGWLYLQLFVCCSVTLTSDAKNNWCAILNISHLLKHHFICMLRVWERERERVPWHCDSWSTFITVVMCLTFRLIYAQDQTRIAMQKRMFGLQSWFGWCDCAVLLFFISQYNLLCVLLPAEVLSVLIQAVWVWV